MRIISERAFETIRAGAAAPNASPLGQCPFPLHAKIVGWGLAPTAAPRSRRTKNTAATKITMSLRGAAQGRRRGNPPVLCVGAYFPVPTLPCRCVFTKKAGQKPGEHIQYSRCSRCLSIAQVRLWRNSVFYTTTKLLFYTTLPLESQSSLCYITVRKGDTNVQVKPKVLKHQNRKQTVNLEGTWIPA